MEAQLKEQSEKVSFNPNLQKVGFNEGECLDDSDIFLHAGIKVKANQEISIDTEFDSEALLLANSQKLEKQCLSNKIHDTVTPNNVDDTLTAKKICDTVTADVNYNEVENKGENTVLNKVNDVVTENEANTVKTKKSDAHLLYKGNDIISTKKDFNIKIEKLNYSNFLTTTSNNKHLNNELLDSFKDNVSTESIQCNISCEKKNVQDIENKNSQKVQTQKTSENFEEVNVFSNPDIFAQFNNSNEDNDNDSEEFLKRNESDRVSNELKDNGDDDLAPLTFDSTETNIYLIDKEKSRSSKEVRRMICECVFEPDDPFFVGCDENCLNRLLMIECNNRCPTREFCTNRNFQKGCQYDLVIFKAGKKGWGLKTQQSITKGSFVSEYCGEVVDYTEFHRRTKLYNAEGMNHYYFMTLKTNEIIDATKKGSKSRFINHSCDPNCITQKWTVNGFLRVGFFALRYIEAGEELSFDYQFQRYGEKPQICYCGAAICRGVIGVEQSGPIPSYIEKIMSSSPTSFSKTKKRRNQIKEFYDSALAGELNELLGSTWLLKDNNQVLELIRLMVKVETLHERRELLKILQSTTNANALKSFVRYKGLSLLWTWMVDAPSHKTKYKVEILKTLKHIPIPNKNELDDSKVVHIVSKWLKKPISQERSSSEEQQSGSENELKIDEFSESPLNDASEDTSSSSNNERIYKSADAESTEEGEIFDPDDEKIRKIKKKLKTKSDNSSKENEIRNIAISLLEEWKALKEVFRIPKKSVPITLDCRSSENAEELRCNKVDSSSVSTVSQVTSNKQIHPDSTCSSPKFAKNPSVDYSKETYEEVLRFDLPDDRRPGRRGWRKSPDFNDRQNNKNNRISDNNRDCDSTNELIDTSWSSRSFEDFKDRRDPRSRHERERRFSYEDNKKQHWQNRNRQVKTYQNWNNRNDDHRQWSNDHDFQYPNENNWRGHDQTWPNQQQTMLSSNPFNPQIINRPPLYPSLTGLQPPIMQNLHQNIHTHMLVPPHPPNIFPHQIQGISTGMNVMITNQQNQPMLSSQHNSPLISPISNQQPYNPLPVVPSNATYSYPNPVKFDSPAQDVTALNVVNQLQLLLSAERLKNAQSSSTQGTPDFTRNSTSNSPYHPSSPNQPKLPPHWKTATDAEGRVYYYHTITRETSWDPPIVKTEDNRKESPSIKKHKKKHSVDESPHSKRSPRIAAADTTHHQGPRTPPDPRLSKSSTSKIKENFKNKLTAIVVACLNSYQRADCKQGKIKNADDFKFLARKLTHGLIMKEIQRIKNEELLVCNDSVKIKVKDYIRNYMKKFGPFYIKS
ncbi:histone-lysine N-methyltransferase SETD2 isoform X2 [Hydra vulgaris]|uniref:[histone H3]-lysine(36) N-trimethyltransferase n=1 Tax=Hydra vulgaris TaxID=6087 RepID=A0ABM4C3N2_HYDVU